MANLFIRCDDETWQMAHALARKESRSLNKQIVHMIKQQAEREGITVEPIPDKQTIIKDPKTSLGDVILQANSADEETKNLGLEKLAETMKQETPD